MAQETLEPPKVKKIPTELNKHGQTRIDNYYWLNQRDNDDVIAYLEAENTYTDSLMKHTQGMQEKLYEEIVGRIKKSDQSVPYSLNGYSYYTRYEDGKEYPIYCRKKIEAISESGEEKLSEELIAIDVNEMAQEHEFYSLIPRGASDDNTLMAFMEDTVGRRRYTLQFKNLESGEILPDLIPDVASFAWAADNKTVFYVRKDPVTLRAYQMYRHEIGEDPKKDDLVFEEKDETFDLYVSRSKSRQYIFSVSYSTLSTEYRFIQADRLNDDFTTIHRREAKHEYFVDHYEANFYIRTNWEAQNFRLMVCPTEKSYKDNWRELIPHRENVLLENVEIFNEHLVLSERKDGLTGIRVMPWGSPNEYHIEFEEEAYVAYPSTNPEFATQKLRFSYSSMTTPSSIYEFDMKTQSRKLLKQQEVVGGYNPSDYQAERLMAPAEDGTLVPISLVYKKGLNKNGNNPVLLYGYGSYGYSLDPSFSSVRLSLLDRGFVFAIAHIRGGEEMGRSWYENGKMFKKKNTFTDFIACGKHLVKEQFTSPDKLFCQGGSAGGLLIGAVINMAPELFHGAIAAVPFVDVVTTMLDESIPLTTSEYDEWGNPNNKDSYEYMLSYSPYDNVTTKNYPHLLVTTGLHDSQVQYFEPAKWVAKLRDKKTDNNRLMLKTDMEAGHGGKSGRYKRYTDTAFNYAFLLDLAGIKE